MRQQLGAGHVANQIFHRAFRCVCERARNPPPTEAAAESTELGAGVNAKVTRANRRLQARGERAFLAAAALMIAGWGGCEMPFPGIPKDGTWELRAKGVKRPP